MTDELVDALSISGVPGVPGVQPSNGGDSDGTPSGNPGVPEVPALADLLASAVEPGAGEAQQETVKPVPEEERPCFRVYDGWTVTDTGRKLKPGVWYHAMSAPKKNERLIMRFGRLSQKGIEEMFQQAFATDSGVVHELEKAQVDREFLL